VDVKQSTRFRYPRLPSSVGAARDQARELAAAWGVPPGIIDSLVLILSELVTNAVRYGQDPEVRVDIDLERTQLRIDVHDGGTGPSGTVQVPDDDEHGRGLLLVAALASRWGVAPDGATWCTLDTTSVAC
jgi:anti-sigma regulatory factor (Ser/Thr protein kinase)